MPSKPKGRVIDEQELIDKLIQRVADLLDGVGDVEIVPRDLAAIGNLVVKLAERQDKLKAERDAKLGTTADVVPMPAMPPINLTKEYQGAIRRAENKITANKGDKK